MEDSVLDALAEEPIDWRMKGFPLDGRYPTIARLRSLRPPLHDGGFTTPLAVIRERELTHNLEQMAEYCAKSGAVLAPHGKTTMAPQLFARQLALGAWGITAATPWQVRVFRAFGVGRVLLANELVEEEALAWLVDEQERDAEFELLSYVDSPASVERVAGLLDELGPSRPLDVLVEVGVEGRRTGCRDDTAILATVAAVRASPHHRLVGVAGFEGVLGAEPTPAVIAGVEEFLARMRATAEGLASAGLIDRERPVLSAGGSAFFDKVVDALGGAFPDGREPEVILRSGGYATHDEGLYRDVSPFTRRASLGIDPLQAAIEVWTSVLSRPEAERAIVDAGRRDLPFDAGMPVARAVRHVDGSTVPVPGAWSLMEMNDQHGFLHVGADDRLAPGDLVAFGISHPCTLFDKWRLIPVVDEEDRVVDAFRTFF